MTRRRAGGIAALVGILTLLWSGPAAAAATALPAPGLVVSHVSAQAGRMTMLVTPVHLAPSSTVEPEAITVRVGDVAAPVEAETAIDLTGAPLRALTVVLDAGDHEGDGAYFAGAIQAANAVAGAVAEDVSLGLVVTTSTGTVDALSPTLDRAAFRSAVAAVQRGGGMDPVDAVDVARMTLVGVQPANERRLLLISDGRYAFSSDFHTRVGESVAGSDIGLDIVAVRATGTGLDALRRIADGAGGRLFGATDAASTVSAAVNSARLFHPTLAVTVSVPGTFSGQTAVVTVEAPGMAAVTTTVAFPTWDNGVTVAVPTGSWVPDWLVYVVALLLFAALVMAVLALLWPRSESHALIKKIAHFGPRAQSSGGSPAEAGPSGRLTRTLLDASATLLRAGKLEERIGLRLEKANMKIRPHEWVALRTGIAVGLGLFFAIVGGLTGFVFGALLGVLATMAYQMVRISRRGQQFTDQLPDGLQLVIGSLRSGFSLSQALESLVRESPEPLAAEFGRAVAEHRLGADLSDALDRLAERVGSEDLSWAVMAVRIQRDVGGNLADVLQTSVDTMREREQLRRHVRALSAEGRLSAWVLIAMPVLVGLFMAVYRGSYLLPMLTDPRGIVMLLVGVVLFAVGIIWVNRVVRVEA